MVGKIKVAVVMATFNGSAYVRDQLESILDQTVQPDVILVSDDNSTDDTVEIIRSVAAPQSTSIRLNVNKRRLGYADNFLTGMKACDADVIFLSDQDDVWAPNKIETMLHALGAAGTLLVTHDIAITGKSTAEILIPSYFEALAKSSIPRSFNVKGCCAAYKRELIDIIGWPPVIEEWSHDEWICHLATVLGAHGYVDQVLMRHRLHGKNVSGQTFTERSPIKKVLRRIDNFLIGDDEARRFVTHAVDPDVVDKLAHHAKRLRDVNPVLIADTLDDLRKKSRVANLQRSMAYKRAADRVPRSFGHLIAGHYSAAGNLSGFLADVAGKRAKHR